MGSSFLRRSLLFVPGSSVRKIDKAKTTAADSIILDLEDAVSLAEKDTARKNVADALEVMSALRKEIVVRVNGLNTFLGVQDLISIVEKKPDTILIPKADVHTIKMADTLVTGLEEKYALEKGKIGFIALLETAAGIQDAGEIICASPRVNGVQLGAEDLTKELSITRTKEGEEIQFARHMVVYAACRNQVDILDTPFTGIQDIDGLEEDTRKAKAIGFTGKTCIYPTHAEHINQLFSPTAEEIAYAHRLLAAFEEAVKEGKGACMFEQKMIDQPVADRAKKIIQKEKFLRLNSKNE